MRSGSKHLRIASVIQILLGVISIISTYFLIGEADIEATGISAEHALIILIAKANKVCPICPFFWTFRSVPFVQVGVDIASVW